MIHVANIFSTLSSVFDFLYVILFSLWSVLKASSRHCRIQSWQAEERQVGVKAVLLSLRDDPCFLSLQTDSPVQTLDQERMSAFKYFCFILSLSKCIFLFLSSLLLSNASSYELLCPNTRSVPSMLVQWIASQQSLGANHFFVPPGTSILKWDHLIHSSLKSLQSFPFWKLPPISVLPPS